MRTSNNLLLGRPLQFGDREQIMLVHEAEDKWQGIKPVADPATVYEGDPGEEYEIGEEYHFTCVNKFCKRGNAIESKYLTFYSGEVYECYYCDAEYRVGEDLNLYHNPNN